MNEILQPNQHNHAGVHKTKKASLKVDLTPMVDLGFLLIAFFVFTTTLAHPTALTLKVPDDNSVKDSSKAPVSKTLNLILGANNKVYAYNGDDLNNLKNSDAQKNFIRSAIFQKKYELQKSFGSDSDIIVLIKPTENATYENIVNALDEMLICSVKTYVLMDASKEEAETVRN